MIDLRPPEAATVAGALSGEGSAEKQVEGPNGSEAGEQRRGSAGDAPEPPSSPEELSHALRLVLWDSLASEGMGTLTSGVFLAGLAVALDASNFMIGVLSAI